MKACRKCHRVQPLEDFPPELRNKDGLNSYCRPCNALRMREWRAAHPAQARASNKASMARWIANGGCASYNETHRESRRVYHQQYNAKNRQRLKHHAAIYYQENKAQMDSNNAAWRKAHPESPAASHARWVAHKKNAPLNDFTGPQWEEIKAAYDHRCVYCSRTMHRLTQDHITPLSQGGSHTASNIVPACRSCNSKKGTGAVLVPVQPLLLTLVPSRREASG